MSELTDAINVFETQRGPNMYPGERLILEAARRYANLDYKAAQLVKIGDPCDIDGERDQANEWVTPRDIQAIVDAALTPPEPVR